jgi:hypothetical protein
MTDQPADYGTNELSKRHSLKPELTGRGHAVRMRVSDQIELDRLLLKGHIDRMEHSAGGSFCQDLHRAGMMGMKTVNYSPTTRGAGGDMSQAHADAVCRVGYARDTLNKEAGHRAQELTLNACLSIVRVTALHDITLLKHGLSVLLSIYQPKHKDRA